MNDVKVCKHCGNIESISSVSCTRCNGYIGDYGGKQQSINGNVRQSYSYTPQLYTVNEKEDMLSCYKKYWKNFTDLSSRVRRSEYWYVVLANFFLLLILSIVSIIPFIGIFTAVFEILYSVAVIIPTISLSVRRLHDIGKSGLYYFFIFIPIVGPIILIVWFAQDSQHGSNEYGKNQKYTYCYFQ